MILEGYFKIELSGKQESFITRNGYKLISDFPNIYLWDNDSERYKVLCSSGTEFEEVLLEVGMRLGVGVISLFGHGCCLGYIKLIGGLMGSLNVENLEHGIYLGLSHSQSEVVEYLVGRGVPVRESNISGAIVFKDVVILEYLLNRFRGQVFSVQLRNELKRFSASLKGDVKRRFKSYL